MNAPADLPLFPAGESIAIDDNTVFHHRAFCRLAMPVRAPSKGSWQREAGGVALQMEAGEGAALASGRFARLLLMQIFDLSLRSGSAVVELGEDPALLASRIGLEPGGAGPREIREQMLRLLGGRVSIAWDGRPALSVFDARGRARSGAPAWRSSVRLSARFQATLTENAVALDRGVLRALGESTLALDLYAWLASALPADAAVLAASWEELQLRFAPASQQPAEFRSAVEATLLQMQQAWPHFVSVIRDDVVEFRRAPEPAPAQAAAAQPTAPAPEPVPAAAETPGAPAEATTGAMAEPPPVPAPPAEPEPEPQLQSQQEPRSEEMSRRAGRQSVSLKPHLTGLPQVVWLQRANGRDTVVIEVTPGGRYDAEQCTVIALEPVALQVWGGLYARDFERVAAWAAANRDLIDDWWESRLEDFDEVAQRVKKVPAPAWR